MYTASCEVSYWLAVQLLPYPRYAPTNVSFGECVAWKRSVPSNCSSSAVQRLPKARAPKRKTVNVPTYSGNASTSFMCARSPRKQMPQSKRQSSGGAAKALMRDESKFEFALCNPGRRFTIRCKNVAMAASLDVPHYRQLRRFGVDFGFDEVRHPDFEIHQLSRVVVHRRSCISDGLN